MKLRNVLTAALCIGLSCGFLITDAFAATGKEPVITVLNPLGTPPPIKLKAMAPRLDTLKGKTIYIVNDGYPSSDVLLKELKTVMEGKYPDTKFVYREKPGGFGREEEVLWKEMEEKSDAMIIALGH